MNEDTKQKVVKGIVAGIVFYGLEAKTALKENPDITLGEFHARTWDRLSSNLKRIAEPCEHTAHRIHCKVCNKR